MDEGKATGDVAPAPDTSLEPPPLDELILASWERSAPGRERHEVAAAIRDDFLHLEAALSMADPRRCVGIVSPAVEAAVQERVEQLRNNGHRRVHGLLEILGASITAASGDAVEVTIDALSSLHELDGRGRVVAGSTDVVRWHQPLAAVQSSANSDRWVITALGPLRTVATSTGPVLTPMDPSHAAAWERHLIAEGRREEGLGITSGSIIGGV